MNQVHYLKTHTLYYNDVEAGIKNFELRKNDRDFHVGDTLVLQCFNPDTKAYDGRSLIRSVDYLLHGGMFGLGEGFCIISWAPDNLTERTP